MDYFKHNNVNKDSVIGSFEYFWCTFSFMTKQYKTNDKCKCKALWDKTISLESKRNAFNNITKEIKISAYEYLLRELKNY